MTSQPLDPGSPPAWAVEGVHLTRYDRRWPDLAAEYTGELRPVLERWLLRPIEHVGSTSIPGVAAKPVIDLMAQVDSLDAVVNRSCGALDGMNWKFVPPELDARPWRRFFAKVSPDGQHRLAHLHLMAAGATRWDQQLLFRDTLRASPDLRAEYSAVKQRLAGLYGADRERYGDEKAAFVKRVLRDHTHPSTFKL